MAKTYRHYKPVILPELREQVLKDFDWAVKENDVNINDNGEKCAICKAPVVDDYICSKCVEDDDEL